MQWFKINIEVMKQKANKQTNKKFYCLCSSLVKNTPWHGEGHINFLRFWNSKMLHCNIKMRNAHDQIAAQAHVHLAYNVWVFFFFFAYSFRVWKVYVER